jgi:hypothetical protein
VRPAHPDLRNDAGNLFYRTSRTINVRRPQLRRQQLLAAEHVERQIAIAVVIAVKEAAFLMAVQRIVRGVDIKNNRRRRNLVRFKEQRNELPFNRRSIMGDLVIARRREMKAGPSSLAIRC